MKQIVLGLSILSSTAISLHFPDLTENNHASASDFLRTRRHNSGFLEEFGADSFEAECVEEQCKLEEHNEIWKSDEGIPEESKTAEFLNKKWEDYNMKYIKQCWNEETRCSSPGTYLCVNKFNARDCICNPGWKGIDCEEDIDECSLDVESEEKACQGENVVCLNSAGSFKCACESGYQSSDESDFSGSGSENEETVVDEIIIDISAVDKLSAPLICTDINECETGAHGCSVTEKCVNLLGSHKCDEKECTEGFQLNMESGECDDIDECAENTHDCDVSNGETCMNTDGSYTCVETSTEAPSTTIEQTTDTTTEATTEATTVEDEPVPVGACPMAVSSNNKYQCATQIRDCEMQVDGDDREHIIMFIDETGSMIIHRQDLIEQYNEFLLIQKSKNADRRYTVIFFNTQFSIFEYNKISDAPLLTNNRWDEGMTVYNPGFNSHIFNTLGCVLHGYQGEFATSTESCEPKTRVILFSNGQNLNENEDIYSRNEVFGIISGLRDGVDSDHCDWRFNFVGLARSEDDGAGLFNWASGVGFNDDEITVTLANERVEDNVAQYKSARTSPLKFTKTKKFCPIQKIFIEVDEALQRK